MSQSTNILATDLIRWLWPQCDQEHVALRYIGSDQESRTGWLHNQADAQQAVDAFLAGALEHERFETATLEGTPYTIMDAFRAGLVLHRGGQVKRFCLDLDDHTGDGGNLRLLSPICRWLGANPVVFTSKSGKGLHAFFELAEAVEVLRFVSWAKAWGFNRAEQPELFPKTDKLTQVWMPGEPNADGGDTYRSGSYESAIVRSLPDPPPVDLTNKSLGFLRGEVTQPGRNEALNVVALELAQKGIGRAIAWGLCERGATLCGLEPDESRRTFESGYTAGLTMPCTVSPSQPQAFQPHPFAHDGIGHAERFALTHKDDARYCVEENEWYVYKSTRWVQSTIGAQAMAKATARTIEDHTARKKASSKHGVKEILFLAASEPGMSVHAQQFDGDPMRFNCQSGTIDLRTGTIEKHKPSDLLRKISPARYETRSGCPRWLSFLDTICAGDQELIDYIQRVCGYMLTGDVSEQCLFFLYGDGCNGKSVLSSLIQFILGDYAVRVPAEMIMKPTRGGGNGPTPDAVRLQGARLAVTSELEAGQTLGESRVKDLTGGDRLVARALYGHPVEFDPSHKILLYGNHKPEICGVDHGIWRRIRLIPLKVTIPDEQRDPYLLDKLKSEADSILAWTVEGCLAWKRDGLGMPRAVHEATGGFRSESDAVGRFIEECCVRGDGVEETKSAIYQRYRGWCETNGEPVLSSKAFSRRMFSHGVTDARRKHARTWVGISLREGEGA